MNACPILFLSVLPFLATGRRTRSMLKPDQKKDMPPHEATPPPPPENPFR